VKNQIFHYARWDSGEVDIVPLDEHGRPDWCMEVKWSDRNIERRPTHGPLQAFIRSHPGLKRCAFTTRTQAGEFEIGDQKINYFPTSAYCYYVGHQNAPDLLLYYDDL